MGRARSKAAPRLTVVDDAGADLSPGPQPQPDQPGMDDRQAVTALQDTFAPTLDWSTPCGHLVPRPDHLVMRKVQGAFKGDLWCNRPTNHQGPHRVYSAEFHVLAEVRR